MECSDADNGQKLPTLFLFLFVSFLQHTGRQGKAIEEMHDDCMHDSSNSSLS